MQPVHTDLMPMPMTSDEGDSRTQTKTDVNTIYLEEDMAHLAQMAGADPRQDALGTVIQNTITSDSSTFPQFILQTL